MLALTFTFFFVEILFGYLTHSMALVADSFHMLSDVLALIVACFCMKVSKMRSSKNTFGWVRAEVLGALVNAVFLLALCFSIFVEALKRLYEPEKIEDPVKILIVGAIGLVVNIIGIFMFHGHASVHGHSHARPIPLGLPEDDDEDTSTVLELLIQMKPIVKEAHNISILNDDAPTNKTDVAEGLIERADNAEYRARGSSPFGRKTQRKTKPAGSAAQLNMHGVFLHILGDAFGSVIVVVNAIIVWKVDNDDVSKYLDPCLSIVLVLIITATTLPLMKESALILLQTVPTHISVSEIKERLLREVDGVLAVHEFHVWRLAGNKIIASAHIQCRTLEAYMKLAEKIKHFFHEEGIHSTTIQPEFVEVSVDGISQHGDFPISAVIAGNDVAERCMFECPPEKCAPSTCCGPSEDDVKKIALGKSRSATGKSTNVNLSSEQSRSLERLQTTDAARGDSLFSSGADSDSRMPVSANRIQSESSLMRLNARDCKSAADSVHDSQKICLAPLATVTFDD